jgi:hypothetical protein
VVKRRWRIIDEERPFGFAWLAGRVVKERTLFLNISVAALLLSVLSPAPPLMLIDRVFANQGMSTLKVLGGALVLGLLAVEGGALGQSRSGGNAGGGRVAIEIGDGESVLHRFPKRPRVRRLHKASAHLHSQYARA